MQPSTIVAIAENLFLEPRQRGYNILRNALNRIVLWRASDALALLEDPPMDDVDAIFNYFWTFQSPKLIYNHHEI